MGLKPFLDQRRVTPLKGPGMSMGKRGGYQAPAVDGVHPVSEGHGVTLSEFWEHRGCGPHGLWKESVSSDL